MNKKLHLTVATLLFCAACAKTTRDRSTEELISDAVEDQATTFNNAVADIDAGGAGIAFSLLSPSEERFLREESLWKKAGTLMGKLFDSSLHAASCAGGGSYVDTGAQFGETNGFTVTRTLTNCQGSGGFFQRNGTVYLQWANLLTTLANNTYVQNGTTLLRAPAALVLTRNATGNTVEIAGDDATTVNSAKVSHNFTWTATTTNTRSFTLNIREKRTGKTASGETRFEHKITTPVQLSVTVDTTAQTRTLISGTVNVRHDIAGVDIATTFSNVIWSRTTCQPTAGSATVTVSGNRSGSGTLAFTNGQVSFTYEGAGGRSASGTITLPNCGV